MVADPNKDKDARLVSYFFGPEADFVRKQLPDWMNEKIDLAALEVLQRFAPNAKTIDGFATAFAGLAEVRAEAAVRDIADVIRVVCKEAGTQLPEEVA
jgi:hypothetical protein